MMNSIFDNTWFGILFPFFLIGCLALGFYVASNYHKIRQRTWVASGVESSLIGFFALLISFTLASSANESKRRATLVHEESDTLGDMIRISHLMKPAARDTVRQFVISYLNYKMDFADEKIGEQEWVHRSEKVLGQFLNFISHRDDSLHASQLRQDQLLVKFNTLSGIFYRLNYSYSERTPTIIMFLLYFSSLLVALLVGFMNGFPEKRHFLIPVIYATMVLLTLQAIRDLDDPLHGSIRPSYNISKDFLKSIK